MAIQDIVKKATVDGLLRQLHESVGLTTGLEEGFKNKKEFKTASDVLREAAVAISHRVLVVRNVLNLLTD